MKKDDEISMLSGILYFLVFAVLLPGELLWWGFSLDGILSGSYLVKRLQLNLLLDLPKSVFLLSGALALGCMIRAFMELSRRSHAKDPLLFGGFPLYVFSLLMYFNKPCAMVVEMPLVVLGAAAVWHTYRPAGRPAFLPHGKGRAGYQCRLWALLSLCGVLTGAGLLFQTGVNLWLFTTSWTWILFFLPLLGLFLPTPDLIRDYVCSSVWALILCGVVNSFGPLVFSALNIDLMVESLSDYEISIAYIFLLLELSLAASPLLPKIRNNSLLLLALCFVVSLLIVPPVGDPRIITCSVYVLYMLIEERRTFYAFLLRLFRRIPKVQFAVSREFTALSWGCAALLAVYLAGPLYSFHILCGIGAVFAGAVLRLYFLYNTNSDHIVLRNFPYALEIFLLVLTAIACSPWLGNKLLTDDKARIILMIVLSSFAAGACLMQSVWNGGGLIGKYIGKPLPHLFLSGVGNAAICFLLVLLFFLHAPASFLLGYFLVLSGILQIRSASGDLAARNLGLSTGWMLIAVGQFIFVSSSTASLPSPKWTPYAAIAGLCALAAQYATWLFGCYCRKRKETAK